MAHNSIRTKIYLVSQRDILAVTAKWAILLHPSFIPANLSKALRQLRKESNPVFKAIPVEDIGFLQISKSHLEARMHAWIGSCSDIRSWRIKLDKLIEHVVNEITDSTNRIK